MDSTRLGHFEGKTAQLRFWNDFKFKAFVLTAVWLLVTRILETSVWTIAYCYVVEWSVVRQDSLTNEQQVNEYERHASPIRSAIFNPGKTSRINVAHFMAELVTDAAVWNKWKGQMPVIYNKS